LSDVNFSPPFPLYRAFQNKCPCRFLGTRFKARICINEPCPQEAYMAISKHPEDFPIECFRRFHLGKLGVKMLNLSKFLRLF
jgi:hypothetical protein